MHNVRHDLRWLRTWANRIENSVSVYTWAHLVHSNKAWFMCEDRTLKFNFDNIYPSTAKLHNSSFPVGVSSFLFGQIGQCHEI